MILTNTLLANSGRSSLYADRVRFIAIEIYKVLHRLSPPFLQDMFERKAHIHNLRNDNTLHLNKFRTIKYGKKSLRYQGAKLWNDLPLTCKNVGNVEDFKKEIRKWSGPECGCGVCLVCLLK